MAKKFNWLALLILFLLLVGGGILLWYFFVFTPQSETTGFSSNLTIKTIDYRTRVDRTNYTEIGIWRPKLAAVFDTSDDYYNYDNFELLIKGVASTLALTPAQFPTHGWIQINPDGDLDQYNETWYKIDSAKAYEVFVYNLTTDVNVNMLSTNTLTNDTVTSENKTIVLNAPSVNSLGLPSTEREKNCQAPLYDLEADTLHTPDTSDIFTRYTSFFAIKIGFENATTAASVNLTIASGNAQSWQTLRSGSNIYIVSKEPFIFPTKGTVEIECELNMLSGYQEIASITTERINVPGDSSTLADGTTYSTIANA